MPVRQFTIHFGIDRNGNCVIASKEAILSSLNKAILSSEKIPKSYTESIYNGSSSKGKRNLIEKGQADPTNISVSR